LDPNAALSRWHLRVNGLKTSILRNVLFPRVPNLIRQENERLAVPVWMGQQTSEPRRMLSATANRSTRMEWHYPGHLSMQCLTLYAERGAGLYVACNDTAAFRKSFAMVGEPSSEIGCEISHLPELSTAPESDWTLPYEVLVGTFQGDWITAAERYRSWATNQVWARESRLARGVVPDWITKTGLWIWNRGRSPGVLTPAVKLQEQLHLPVSVFWHWWHGCPYDTGFPEYLPPREGAEAFSAALDAAHERNVRTLVYMNQRLWGMTTKSWVAENAEKWAVKRPNGEIGREVYNTFNPQPCASMCLGTEFWRKKYASLAQQAVQELGVDGIYMDQACTSLACYDSTHGHTLGGGAYWMNGFRQMSLDIRKRSLQRSVNRGAGRQSVGLAGEGCGESWLPYLDLMLSLQVSRERYAGQDGWQTIPFFNAVYHAYAVTYGNYSSLTLPPYDDLWPAEFAPKEPLKLLDRKFSRQFLLEQARAFVWGQQPTVANFLPNHLHDRAEEMEYVLRLARLRQAAAKYLLRGGWLRPPHINTPEAVLDMSRLSIYAGQQGGLKSFQQSHPLVLAGAWRAPDGDVAIALASIADEPIPIRFKADLASYHKGRRAKLFRLDQGGRLDLGKLLGESPEIAILLPARGACLLELK
jgi:hypothetical protein